MLEWNRVVYWNGMKCVGMEQSCVCVLNKMKCVLE